jgi:hypothetical protein
MAQIRIGLQGGYSMVGWINSIPSESHTTSNLGGFQYGVVSELRLSKHWLVRPGLFVSRKGSTLKYASSAFEDTSARDIWIDYVDLPVMLEFRETLYKQLKGFVGAGYYLAYAFRGVEKGAGRNSSGSYDMYNEVDFTPLEYQTYPSPVNHFDHGLALLTGIEFRNAQLLFSYDRGLKNVLKNNNNGNYMTNTLSISLAYILNAKKYESHFR